MRYRFGAFELDASQYELRREGSPLRVEPRVLDLLLYLIRNRDRIVPREELFDALWKEKFIGDAALTRCVAEARKAIAVDGEDDPIKTIHRRGYRFVAAVTEEERVPGEGRGEGSPAPPSHSAPHPDPLPARRGEGKKWALFAAAIAVVIAVAMLAAWKRPKATPDPAPLRVSRELKITRLTTSGKAIDAAIAPDGKLIAYVVDDAGLRSLRVRQIDTGSERELLPGVPRARKSLLFTPDGNYIVYLEEDEAGAWALHRVAALGGVPQRLVESVEDSPWSKKKDVSFASDGERVAFVRRLSPERTAVVISDLRTQEERQVHARNGELFRPIWTGDGDALLCHWKVPGYATEIRLLEISLRLPAHVREIPAPKTPLFVAHGVLPDARHLIGVGGHSMSRTAIYLAGYPSMEIAPITQGNVYWQSPSVTPDGRKIVAVRVQENYNLWIGDRQITFDIDAMEGTHGIDVTPNGEFVYTARTNGEHNHIWIASPDGRNVRQLTSGPWDEYWPAVSPSGATIFYGQRQTTDKRTMRIWRMDLATGSAKQLTTGSWDMLPVVTRDGRWLIYSDGGGAAPLIKRIPSSGGRAETIAPGILFAPMISPDGTLLAGLYARTMSDRRTLVTMRIEDGSIVERFPVAGAARWAADGRGLIVMRDSNGVGNLWLYPLGGGTPRQITDFSSLEMMAFNLLPGGKQFVFSRGEDVSDVMLITDLLAAR